MADRIFFEHIGDTDLSFLDQNKCASWLIDVIEEEGHILERINYIFCSDDYLLELNKEYLGQEDYTDILTFPMNYQKIEADIFISIDRVKENAITYKLPFEAELHRVIIHGILHMCGYNDKTDDEAKLMREKENHFLSYL